MIDTLLDLEADAVRRVAGLPNDELAGLLADLIDRLALGLDDGRPAVGDLRELAAVALVTARRIEAGR